VDVDDKGANMNLGMLYKESLEFDLSIKHLRKALDGDKSDTIVLTNLATTLSRNNEVPAAVKFIEDIIEINDSPAAHFSIGTVTAP
jgi:tetratricopeptide (TPR) repeat protein